MTKERRRVPLRFPAQGEEKDKQKIRKTGFYKNHYLEQKMKKQDKINLIASSIGSKQIVRMYFKYDENYWYFYPNAVSERLMLGQEENDFQLNGYQIRRISDLVKAEIKDDLCSKIDIWKGIIDGIHAPEVDVTSWQTVFRSAELQDKCFIIEDENNGVFRIGFIKRAYARYVSLYHFGANGEFDEEPYIFPYSKITTVSWNTRYTKTWHEYLQAHDLIPKFVNS